MNSVRHFGGRALFVDAGNSADPYLIRREADLRKKDSAATRKLLQSIEMMRVFTCHQLYNFVIDQLPAILSKNRGSDNPIKFVGVSGFDFVFSEDDSPKKEIENLQYLISRKLGEISKDRENGVMFVVVSSDQQCSHLLNYSDVAIEIYHDKRNQREKAVLMRHYSRRGLVAGAVIPAQLWCGKMTFDQFAGKKESPETIVRRLKEEIDSWRPYAEALRQEDREVFKEMMNGVAASYNLAIERAERGYDTEAVMMSILLNQQKTISWLSSLLKRIREESRSAPP